MRALPATDEATASRDGFTIVELMVSVAVLSLLVVLLATSFNQVSSVWTAGEGNVEHRRSARALADFIGTELQAAVLPLEGVSVAGTGNLQFVVNPPNSQVPEQYRFSDAVFWQAPLATEASFGDLAEVGYFVQWIKPDPSAPGSGVTAARPALCRFFVNPSVPGASGPKANDDFLIYKSDPKAWLNSSLIQKVAPANNEKDNSGNPNAFRGLFAENVVGFWVECFDLNGNNLYKTSVPARRGFDSRVGYKCDFEAYAGNVKQKWQEMRYLPASARISFAQMDSRSANRLDATPVADKVKALSIRTDVENAGVFVEELRTLAKQDSSLAPLLPGLRIYSTEVTLQNAR